MRPKMEWTPGRGALGSKCWRHGDPLRDGFPGQATITKSIGLDGGEGYIAYVVYSYVTPPGHVSPGGSRSAVCESYEAAEAYCRFWLYPAAVTAGCRRRVLDDIERLRDTLEAAVRERGLGPLPEAGEPGSFEHAFENDPMFADMRRLRDTLRLAEGAAGN